MGRCLPIHAYQLQAHSCMGKDNITTECTEATMRVHAERDFLHIQVIEVTQSMHVQEVLGFTDSQQQDMLYLRRLFYGKLGQLARERASILQQVDAAEPCGQPSQPMPFNLGFRHTADKLTETQELADQLCANRAEESRTYMYCVVCLYRCVSLSYTVLSVLFTTHCSQCSLSKLCLDAWLPVAADHKHNIHCERFPCLCITSLVSAWFLAVFY